MELRAWKIGGSTVVAEDENEAIEMFKAEYKDAHIFHSLIKTPLEEHDLDRIFYYFNLDDIDTDDYEHIYDKKYPSNGVVRVSLKRQYA